MSTAEVSNDLGTVFYNASYDAENKIVVSDWEGYVTVEDVKNGANKGLEVFLSHQGECVKMLNLNDRLEGSWDEANEWIATEWMPKALGGGLKYFAHVVSPDIFAQLSAETLEQNFVEAGFTMKTFGSREDAEAWLKSVG